MDRLLYPNGGREIFGDDLQWENSVWRDTVKAILGAICPDATKVYILSGLRSAVGATGEASLSAGYIAWNGEAYPCAGYVDRLQQGLLLYIQIGSEMTEIRTLRNRQTAPTRELRNAKIVTSSQGNWVFSDAIRVNEPLSDMADDLILPSNLTAPSDVSQRPRALKRDGQDLIRLLGCIVVNVPLVAGSLIGFLPAGLSPSSSIFITAYLNSVHPIGVLLCIEPNGRIFTPYYIGVGEINLNNTIFC